MRTLEEINEKLYKNMSRLHRYEAFMDNKKCAAVRKNIFEEYQRDIELYKEERKLQREKSLFEVRALTKSLKPFSFFGLFRKRTGKRAQIELSELEDWYCEHYELSQSVYEAITPEKSMVTEQAELEMAEADENGAAEPETEAMEQSDPKTEPTEPTEPTETPELAEPTEPAEPEEEEEVIFDDEDTEEGENEEEDDEPEDPREPEDKPDKLDEGDDKGEEASEEGNNNGEVSEFGESEQGIFRHENVCDLQDL